MMSADELFYVRALRRIETGIAWLSASGTLAATVSGGWRRGIGFMLGAGASYLNFRWLKQMAQALGDAAQGKPPRTKVALFLGLRYVLLAASCYVIVKYSSLSLVAGLIGLFVPVAAVILEILFEIVYAGT